MDTHWRFRRSRRRAAVDYEKVVVRDERTFVLETVEYIAQVSAGLPIDRAKATVLAEPVFAWLDEAHGEDDRGKRVFWLRSAFIHRSEAPLHHDVGRWLDRAQQLPTISGERL